MLSLIRLAYSSEVQGRVLFLTREIVFKSERVLHGYRTLLDKIWALFMQIFASIGMEDRVMETAPLFNDLPIPPTRHESFEPTYRPRNKAMSTAIQFAVRLTETSDPIRKRDLKEKMVLAILAKDEI